MARRWRKALQSAGGPSTTCSSPAAVVRWRTRRRSCASCASWPLTLGRVMGAAAGVSEPILFSVTEPRLGSLVLLLCALAAAVGVALILAGPHHRGRGWPLALRAFLGVCLVGLLVNGFRAGLRVASPPVQLKATERGLTSYVTVAHPSGIRLQLARHADAEGIFVPWQAMEALHLERLRC